MNPAKGDMMSDEELVVVLDATNGLEAKLYQTMLEEAGVRVLATNSRQIISDALLARLPYRNLRRLQVFRSDAPRAMQLIEDYRREVDAGNLALEADESEEPTPAERKSGSTVALSFFFIIVFFALVAMEFAVVARGWWNANTNTICIAAFGGAIVLTFFMSRQGSRR